MNDILGTYWRGVADRLQTEAQAFNALIGHNGEVGRANENSLSAILTNLLPNSVAVGTGVLINHRGTRSPQTDLVAYAVSDQPRLLAQTTQTIFPVETVPLAVEVKTSLTVSEVEDVASKFCKIRTMYDEVDRKRPHLSLFAYTCGGNSPSTILKKVHQLEGDAQPDSVCIMRPAAFGRDGVIGFVPLHESDASGDRISGQWRCPDTAWKDDRLPVTRVNLHVRQKVVTEPGRALLLYADALLSALSSANLCQNSWLNAYIPPIARETLEVQTALESV